MSLRENQISSIRLSQETGFMIHVASSVAVFLLADFFWFKKVFDVPEEIRFWIALAASAAFFFSLFGMVKEGYVGALLWNGAYTDDSYSGLYCTPKPPFPIMLLAFKIFVPDIYNKLFWSMGTIIPVQDISVPVTAQALSSDGIRFHAETMLVFELESAARFLIQTSNNTDTSSLFAAVTSLYVASVKSSSLSSYTQQEIYTGEYQKDQSAFISTLMSQFDFIKNYGLRLAKTPIVKVTIESKSMEKVFDQVVAATLLDKNASNLANRVKEFMKKNPGMNEAVVWALLSGSSGDDARPGVNIFSTK